MTRFTATLEPIETTPSEPDGRPIQVLRGRYLLLDCLANEFAFLFQLAKRFGRVRGRVLRILENAAQFRQTSSAEDFDVATQYMSLGSHSGHVILCKRLRNSWYTSVNLIEDQVGHFNEEITFFDFPQPRDALGSEDVAMPVPGRSRQTLVFNRHSCDHPKVRRQLGASLVPGA
jgi:hypothetical protein